MSHRDLVTDFLNGMVTRDRQLLTRALAEDVVWHVPPASFPQFSKQHDGREACLTLIADAGPTMFIEGTQRIAIMNLLVDGDQAAVQFRMTGRMPGDIDYDNQYAFFFRCAGDRIVEVWENIDTAYVYRRLGIEATWIPSGKK